MRNLVAAAVCLLTVALTGCGGDDDASSPGTATSRPAGAQVGEWWVHGPTIQGGSMFWSFTAENTSDVEQSTYLALRLLDTDGSLVVQAQCMNMNTDIGEFAEPGEVVALNCAPADGTRGAGELPEFDHFTLSVLPGFPTSSAEREAMGH